SLASPAAVGGEDATIGLVAEVGGITTSKTISIKTEGHYGTFPSIFMTAPGDIAVQGSIVLRSSEPLDNGQLSLTSDSGSVTLGKTIHMVGRGEGGQVLASAGKDITINGSIAARSGPFYSRAGIVQLFANGLVDVTARKIDISARPGAYSSSSDGLN